MIRRWSGVSPPCVKLLLLDGGLSATSSYACLVVDLESVSSARRCVAVRRPRQRVFHTPPDVADKTNQEQELSAAVAWPWNPSKSKRWTRSWRGWGPPDDNKEEQEVGVVRVWSWRGGRHHNHNVPATAP